ncbi:OmpA family protein [Myxosarcina sp. GI1]|uniref:OmpA family protein n=1 Tax=Myxosarcina sp. GI1 TaxID=1541065 RepID=UPI00068E1BBD|nr:OmpA family protein [Myxosarcina sp. GI1]
MSQQPNEPNSEAAEQLEELIDLLFDVLLQEKQSERQSLVSQQDTFVEREQQPPESETAEIIPLEITTPSQSLRQTSSDEEQESDRSIESTNLSDLRQLIATLEQKLKQLESQIYEPTEIINPLLPLITELLEAKSNETQESLLNSLIPIVDEIIRQKSQQSPQSIGKAIAPEIAFAIQEQILLERDSISRVLGPQMGEAIKNQIVVERDAMVDALYPVIGNTISKYMVEVVKDINKQVENTFSPEGIKRKIRAKVQGVSEAELIFKEAMQYAVLAVFLIHKDSGLVIRDVQPESTFQLEADMIAGMLTAIRVFVNDSVAIPGEVSELHEIEYDASKIIIEVAGYCYLAVVVKGEPSKALLQKIRDTLGTIVLDYGRFIEGYNGDPTTIPDSLQPLLVDLVEVKRKEPRTSSLSGLLVFLLVVVSLVFLPLGFLWYRSYSSDRQESKIAAALDANPELSVYRLTPKVRQGQVVLTGRVPSQYLQTKAAQAAERAVPELELTNQVVAVDVPPDPIQTAAEVRRATALINRRQGINITTSLNNNTVTVSGNSPDEAEVKQIVRELEQIPGVRSVIATVETAIPILDTKIYFESGSAQIEGDASEQIRTVEQFLTQHPNLHLKIIGHSDSTGAIEDRHSLALKRARAVERALIERGIEPLRLQVFGSSKLPPDVTESQPSRLSRVVRFETFIPPKN